MIPRIYVAGASREVATVAGIIAELESLGYVITHNWTEAVRACAASGLKDSDLSPTERARHARTDLNGVISAHIFWLVAPEDPKSSLGCWIELGAALGSHWAHERTIIASGNVPTIFAELLEERFATHAEALMFIQKGWPV